MKPTGLFIIFAACLLPWVWLPSIGQGRDLIALVSQYVGMIALIVMAFAQLIATRWPGVEAVFGPLDQSYRLHKWLGISAMVAILLHDTIDADMRGLGGETLLNEAAETAGEISLYGLLILVVITVATFIPYHLWKWTHRLIGIFFVLGAAHYLFILKPFKNGDPLGLYMAAVCAIGILAYLYTSAPRGLRPARRYTIESTEAEGSALAVEMAPQGRALRHKAGQFAFFAFDGAGLPEPHPFTISSGPRSDNSLRVTIAPLGDLTNRYTRALNSGQSVRVDGAFGHFGRSLKGQQIWIGAGVGITPFVALAEALSDGDGPVQLIYAVRTLDDAAHVRHLHDIAAGKANLDLTIWESAERGRLDPDSIAEISGHTLADCRVLFCGPGDMRRALAVGLQRHGVSQRRFHYEEFEIRTGLGVRAFLRWLGARI
ncbi:MAG: ferric reductase-like transmembrane domain-containing protein [Pseudomonadota bacterium]